MAMTPHHPRHLVVMSFRRRHALDIGPAEASQMTHMVTTTVIHKENVINGQWCH